MDCSQFADWWEVVTDSGTLVYRRILDHRHTDPTNCSQYYLGRPSPPVNGGEYFAFSHILALDVLYRF